MYKKIIRSILPVLLLSPLASLANSYYVNDGSTSGDVYTTAIGNDANAGTAAAPFATLSRALLAATDGDNIYVDAGNYITGSTVSVTKSVNIYGANASVSGYGARGTETFLDFTTNPAATTSDIDIAADTGPVLIKGITLRDDISTTGSPFNRNGVSIQASAAAGNIIQNNIFERNANVSGAAATPTKNSLIYAIFLYGTTLNTIDNNYFHGLSTANLFNNSSWRSGLWMSLSNVAATITNNHFLNIRSGLNVNPNPSLSISGNNFDLGAAGTTAIATGGGAAGTAYTLGANNFTGYGIYISLANTYASNFIMDATSNTYNGNVFSGLNQADGLAVEASLKHANQAGLNGFIKIKPGNVYVTPAANGDAAKSIQKTIDNFAQNGDIVNIGTNNGSLGTFIENVVVNKEVTLLGQGQSTVLILPAVSMPQCSSGAAGSLCSGGATPGPIPSNIILVKANNVSVKNLTIDGNNPSLTSGQVFGGQDIDARNGIITDHTTGSYTNLTVDNVSVKNIFLRGIYNSTGGTFTFSNNTVDNVQADPASIAMFNSFGSGAFTNNTVSNANDAISSNWSTGTTYSGNTITASGSGIHTDNNGGSGGTADVIQNNTVTNSPAGGYGIFVFVPYVAPTINANTITNVETGLAVFGSAAALSPSFTNNTVDAQNKANSVAIYQTTDQLGFGSNNVAATYTNNFLRNNATAVAVTYQAGYTNNITVNNNSITGNTTGVSLTPGGTLVNNFNCNWWGAASSPAVIAAIGSSAASINYSPWLVSGTDNSAATGFQPVPGSCSSVVVPIIFTTGLTGTQLSNANKLQWSIASGTSLTSFEIERGTDGTHFNTIATISAGINTDYSYFDNAIAADQKYYYRLKSIENTGAITYSNVVLLSRSGAQKSRVFPSPFTTSVTIWPSLAFKNRVIVSVYNAAGQKILVKAVSRYISGDKIALSDLDKLPSGIYNIVLESEDVKEKITVVK